MRSDAEKLYLENEKLVYYMMKKRFPLLLFDEDFLQIARIGLWKACTTYDEKIGAFSTWGAKCIFNEVLCTIRHQKRKKELVTISLNEQMYNDSEIEEFLEGDKDVAFVDQAGFLQALTKRQRTILMYMLGGVKQEEIGKQLGIGQSMVSREIKKIREKFNEFI